MAKKDFRMRRIWLPSLLGRASWLLLTLSIITFFFYIIGNTQQFADKTLEVLFLIESWLLALCGIVSLFATISYSVTIPLRSHLKLSRIFFSVVAAVISFILYICVALLRAFMDGYT